MAITWEDPIQTVSSRREAWDGILVELKAKPNRWAKIEEYPDDIKAAGSKAGALRARQEAYYPGENWEFTGRSDGKSSFLYGRFVKESRASKKAKKLNKRKK